MTHLWCVMTLVVPSGYAHPNRDCCENKQSYAIDRWSSSVVSGGYSDARPSGGVRSVWALPLVVK